MLLQPDGMRLRARQAIWPVLCGLLALLTLAACSPERPSTSVSVDAQSPAEPAVARPTAPSHTTVPTKTPNYKQVAETQIAATYEALQTRAALTAAPTRTPGPPPIYPTPTLRMGWIGGCTPKNSLDSQCLSGWREVINGEVVTVYSGMEGRLGDPMQGLIMVSVLRRSFEIYNTPVKAGPVRIVAVDGMLITLATVDLRTPGVVETPWATQTPGTLFVFDLTTRQWVPPSPPPSPSTSPWPTRSPAPPPSASPAP
jgi:hypothetical protein